jgi:predicted transcriptional regulator of viral defense system
MMSATQSEALIDVARRRGIVTTGEVEAAGIHRQTLTRLVRDGVLERVERGRYRLRKREVTEHHGLVVAAAAAPQAVVCLISALAFHEIGTQIPHEVWLALEGRAHKPKVDWPPVRFVRFSGEAFSGGIEIHELEGREVRVYSVAKTLADCFKYRNKIGLDVALEALREVWSERRTTIDEIERYARICRVDRVMRPYLEALVT